MNSAPAGTAEKNAERTIVLSHFSGTERKKMKPISECAARKNGECRRIFTLIELLIVIAVIAILTGLLLPALQSAKRKVYTTSCVSSMKQIGQAIYLYIGDNDDYPPAPREWANYMLNGNYIPKKNSTKLYGTLAVFKIRHLMICPMFSSVTDSALWPADQAPMEWSVTTYTPPVGYHDWDAEFDTYGWGFSPMNIVIKLVAIKITEKRDFNDTCKMSEDLGKYTGKPETVELFKTLLHIK